MKPGLVSKGASRYVVGEVEKFDQKNEMFSRSRWDPSLIELGKRLWAPEKPRENTPGYTLRDYALENAAWYLPIEYTGANIVGNQGLYSWNTKRWGVYGTPGTEQLAVDDPAKMTRAIKKIAKLMGASLAGVCELDQRWLYSHEYDWRNYEYTPIEIQEEYKYAIVLGY